MLNARSAAPRATMLQCYNFLSFQLDSLSLSLSLFAYYSILPLPSSVSFSSYPKLRPSSSSSSCSSSSSLPSFSRHLSPVLHPSSSSLSSPLPSSLITLVLCPSYYTPPRESSRYLWNLLDRASAAFLVARSKTSLEEESRRVSPSPWAPGTEATFQSSLRPMPVRGAHRAKLRPGFVAAFRDPPLRYRVRRSR